KHDGNECILRQVKRPALRAGLLRKRGILRTINAMQATDADLMEAAKRGDIRAFDELVSRYSDRVYSFVSRIVGEGGAAEDAAQEAFIKVWKNRKKFEPEKNFKSWLFTIARNAAYDILRKRKDRPFSSLEENDDGEEIAAGITDESVDLPQDFDRGLAAAALRETLEDLTPDQRAAVVLHDVEGMTFDEAGKTLGKPLNTVKSHYRRALATLRKKLKEKGFTGPY
ncbi:MAG TPA: RNA polymerase sigma factor, partial [Candidatus Paceibacterota bacterium]|nr:RNA polymerase sigma factor [Candidatus Paceibacterota bacterium]